MPNKSHSYITLLTLLLLLSACKDGSAILNLGSGGTTMGTGFTWIAGSDTAEQSGTYGIQGTANTANTPGARQYAVTWTDINGDLWLFGGYGFDSTGTASGYLNDLWRFDGSNWTWVAGSDSLNQNGTYGTLGTADAANIPGARSKAVSWIDGNGNLWLFGGIGYSSRASIAADLNDLWKYDITNANWTWVAGSSLNNVAVNGCYSTTVCTLLQPGSREHATGWTDVSGNYLWLFGGTGLDSNGDTGYLNDFWKFDITNQVWTWVGGSDTSNQNGSYSIAAMPGGREGASGWVDANGIFWLFGGYGLDGNSSEGSLNDLWQYDTSWVWSGKGDQTTDAIGKYSLPLFVPGSRDGATGWTDSDGNLWLFGGQGYDGTGNLGDLNDVWKFDRIGSSGWNWVTGENTVDQSGVYGTQGISSTTNVPGARQGAASWIDADETIWIFGGNGWDGYGASGNLNDLWQYQP